MHNLDARLSREFARHEGLRLQFLVEAFNLANYQNILSVNTAYSSYVTAAKCPGGHTNDCIEPYVPSKPSGAFGLPSSTTSVLFGPRQAQFSAKFLF